MRHTHTECWIPVRQGISVEGREIRFFVTGSDTEGPLDTLILGAFHGDERESEQVTAAFLAQVSAAMLDHRRVGIVPVVNPDGFRQNQRVNAHSVDLNRNFPTRDWAELNPETIYYSGKAAGSEPETQFILTILAAFPPRKILSLHTPYRVINYDGPAQALAETMAQVNGYPVVADIGYATPGSFGTYVGKERQIATITLELPEENFDAAELARNLEALCAAILWDSPPA